MPIEATPFEQEVLLEATKLTEEPTVLPLLGLEIETPAQADAAAKTKTQIEIAIRAGFFIRPFFSIGKVFESGKTVQKQRDLTRRLRQDTLGRSRPLTSPSTRFREVRET